MAGKEKQTMKTKTNMRVGRVYYMEPQVMTYEH